MIQTDQEAKQILFDDLSKLADVQAKKVGEIYELMKEAYGSLVSYLSKQKNPFRVLRQLSPLNFSTSPLSKTTEQYIIDYYREVIFIPQLENRVADEVEKTTALFPKLSFSHTLSEEGTIYTQSEQYRVWCSYYLKDSFGRTIYRKATNFFVLKTKESINLIRIPNSINCLGNDITKLDFNPHVIIEPWTLWGYKSLVFECPKKVDIDQYSSLKILPNGDCLCRQSGHYYPESSIPVQVADVIAGRLSCVKGDKRLENTIDIAIDTTGIDSHFRLKQANSNQYPSWVGTDLLDGSQYFSPWFRTENGDYLEFIRVVELGCYNLSKKLASSSGVLLSLNFYLMDAINWIVTDSNFIDVVKGRGYTGREPEPVFFKPGERLKKFISASVSYYKPSGYSLNAIFSVLTKTNPIDIGLHLSDSYEKYRVGYENVLKIAKEV